MAACKTNMSDTAPQHVLYDWLIEHADSRTNWFKYNLRQRDRYLKLAALYGKPTKRIRKKLARLNYTFDLEF